MTPFEIFLGDLDRVYAGQRPAEAAKVRLRILGSMALMIQADYVRGTKDGDVLESIAITPSIKLEMLALGGQETALANRHGLYLDFVPSGILFRPMAPVYHPLPELSATLACFELEVLAIPDVCVTKLKRFNSNDQTDLAAMVRLGNLDHTEFVDRFLSAIDFCRGQAFSDDYPKFVDHLHQVERDQFLVPETRIDLRTNPYESED